MEKRPRLHYIDNLRIFCIMLLIPFHTAMMFNAFGEPFYVHGAELEWLTLPLSMLTPWWMPLMFTVAGVSAAYSLERRSAKEFLTERVRKLLLPLVVGVMLIIPVQFYIADVYWNGYSGGYFAHYGVFFTKFTDLTGYDGGFTPGQLWFALYLFAAVIVAMPIVALIKKRGRILDGGKIKLWHLLPLFLFILVLTPILEFSGGKSVGEAIACFLLGLIVLSPNQVQDMLGKSWLLLTGLFLGISCVHATLNAAGVGGIIWDIEFRIVKWFGILAFFGVWRRFCNRTNRLLQYLSKAAFPLYYFHQSILVVLGYFVLQATKSVPLQFLLIISGTLVLTLLCYEIFRRFKLTRFLFGISK